jgi:hypothetical protein
MNSNPKIVATALLLGAATVAAAQTPARAPSFAEQFRQMQALNSTSPYAFALAQPTLGTQAADREGRQPFARQFAAMQAVASNSGQFAFAASSGVQANEANSTLVAGRPLYIPSKRNGG